MAALRDERRKGEREEDALSRSLKGERELPGPSAGAGGERCGAARLESRGAAAASLPSRLARLFAARPLAASAGKAPPGRASGSGNSGRAACAQEGSGAVLRCVASSSSSLLSWLPPEAERLPSQKRQCCVLSSTARMCGGSVPALCSAARAAFLALVKRDSLGRRRHFVCGVAQDWRGSGEGVWSAATGGGPLSSRSL